MWKKRRSRTHEMKQETQHQGSYGGEGKDMMNSLEQATDAFIVAILESDVYRLYRTELEKVKEVPGLKEQIDEFRRRNYELQSSSDNDFDKLERFEKEYENFRDNPLVSDFLAAELDLCRMLQDISTRVTAELEFE